MGRFGRQGPAATLRQHCPQMTQRRCTIIRFTARHNADIISECPQRVAEKEKSRLARSLDMDMGMLYPKPRISPTSQLLSWSGEREAKPQSRAALRPTCAKTLRLCMQPPPTTGELVGCFEVLHCHISAQTQGRSTSLCSVVPPLVKMIL